MKCASGYIRLSASDLSNHLACNHLTSLDLSVAVGEKSAPSWKSPDLWVLQERGIEHEKAYLSFLADKGLTIVDLRDVDDDGTAFAKTCAAMKSGVPVIVQATLESGQWFGRADVLQRVEQPSKFGGWSYEVYDCKLARETKAETILQLSLYSELLEPSRGFCQNICMLFRRRKVSNQSRTGFWTLLRIIDTSKRAWKRPLSVSKYLHLSRTQSSLSDLPLVVGM